MSDLAEAITAYRNGALAASLRIARAILSKDSKNAGAHYLIGIISADSGKLSDATISLQRAIQISPSNSNFYRRKYFLGKGCLEGTQTRFN